MAPEDEKVLPGAWSERVLHLPSLRETSGTARSLSKVERLGICQPSSDLASWKFMSLSWSAEDGSSISPASFAHVTS